MKFKVDENLPEEVVTALRAHGHDTLSVAGQGLAGKDDQSSSPGLAMKRVVL